MPKNEEADELTKMEDATIRAFNELNLLSSRLPERLYPTDVIEEIRKYQAILKSEFDRETLRRR